jgi:phosphatidylserine/phosphatidylglycerophosphate/cardiolipin synthase-like enzyme
MAMQPSDPTDDLAVTFLAQGEQTAQDVAERLAAFIHEAQHTLDIAIYDFRLDGPARSIVAAALTECAARGVAIRIAYDADKPTTPRFHIGMDPAPSGTGALVQSLGLPYRRIGGLKLMHHKYMVRDVGTATASVWTGSLNFTNDAWTLQENNVLQIRHPALALAYAQDFTQLWESGTIGASGDFDPALITVTYGGQPAQVQLLFSPGRGATIDYEIALRIAQAQRRVRICSMLLNSGALLAALGDLLHVGRVQVDGIYDRTQQASVLEQWQEVPHNHWKIRAIYDVVEGAHLVGKASTPYSPTSKHDFMHNKILVIDDEVITGSYNFSRSAELNAENILRIQSPALAETYSRMIDHLLQKYRS